MPFSGQDMPQPADGNPQVPNTGGTKMPQNRIKSVLVVQNPTAFRVQRPPNFVQLGKRFGRLLKRLTALSCAGYCTQPCRYNVVQA